MNRLHAIAVQHGWAFARTALFVGVLGAKYLTCVQAEMSCLRATRASDDGLAAVVCEREYARTRDPATGARLASALRRSGQDSAEALANVLLATTARADALTVLGKIAYSKGQLDVALERLEAARSLHFAELQLAQVAADDQALAGIFRRQKRFTESLRALGDCVAEARQGGDTLIEGYCHLSSGLVLEEVGYFEGAQAELDASAPMLVSDRDLAALDIERAALEQRRAFALHDPAKNRFAVTYLERAIKHAARGASLPQQITAELNLAYSLAEVGDTAQATRHLERARILDLKNSDAVDRAVLEARIAYRAGNGARAMTLNTAVFPKLTDDDVRIEVCVIQARIAMAAGDLELAVTWATRGVEVAERLRHEVSAVEMRPWVLSTRRQPHELLFAALVRSRKLEAAVVAFDHWQARTLLDSSLRDAHGHVDLRTAAGNAERYYRAFPVLSSAPFTQPIEGAVLLDRLRDVDLVALLVADDEVWRIGSRHGALDIVSVGQLAALRKELGTFIVTPTSGLANSLGDRLLGADAFRDTDEALVVVLDGEPAALPIAALRAGGRPLVAMRPIVRAPRLSEVGCVEPLPGPRHAVVIADARGDLPEAARGAIEIAARFGVVPAIRNAATSDVLFRATRDDVLSLGIHASVEPGVGTLFLHDRQVSAHEIAAHGNGPALVVMSSCLSAIGDDAEQATSLANAFLAAGSRQVIATLQQVTDTGARELTSRFFREGGATDPVRALARIQAALAATLTNSDWPYFVLFGHDTCRKELP
ncbi:MAG TPA: CHAT domain-containing protein [Kofleriaceae bacterium]|nr:CHAT domain-containing protein [Kofleriaceae bacterium]